jgi:hypothetical protein
VHAPLHAGNYFTYQLVLATTDLRLHSTFDPAGNMTASQVQHEQYKKIMVSNGNSNPCRRRLQLTTMVAENNEYGNGHDRKVQLVHQSHVLCCSFRQHTLASTVWLTPCCTASGYVCLLLPWCPAAIPRHA